MKLWTLQHHAENDRYPEVKRTKTNTEMLTVLALAGQLNKACKSCNRETLDFLQSEQKEAQHELTVQCNNKLLLFCFTFTTLGVTLDRSISYRHHFTSAI